MIDAKKVANSHKSFTVWAGAMFGVVSMFFMKHPGYIQMIVETVVSEKWVPMAKDVLIYMISGTGALSVWFGRVRKSKTLEER